MAAAIGDLVEDWIGTPPVVYFQFQRALNNPESSFEDFGEIISADPGLSARLLRIVNSPFYGFESKVETITHTLLLTRQYDFGAVGRPLFFSLPALPMG